MDEIQIRYCTATDDASIAYTTMGAGPAVVLLPSFHSFGARLRLIPYHRSLCDTVAQNFTVIQFDARGMGLSVRERGEYDLEARLRDLEAVIAAARCDTVALVGWAYGGFAAIAYTRRHLDRVRSLVLIDALSSGERYFTQTPGGRFNAALGAVTAEQWEQVTEAIGLNVLRGTFPDAGPTAAHDTAAALRETWTPEAFLAHRQALRAIDVTAELPEVAVPTLVVSTATTPQRAEVFAHSRELASAIPNARLLRVTPRAGPVGRNATTPRLSRSLAGTTRRNAEPTPPSGMARAPCSSPTSSAIPR